MMVDGFSLYEVTRIYEKIGEVVDDHMSDGCADRTQVMDRLVELGFNREAVVAALWLPPATIFPLDWSVHEIEARDIVPNGFAFVLQSKLGYRIWRPDKEPPWESKIYEIRGNAQAIADNINYQLGIRVVWVKYLADDGIRFIQQPRIIEGCYTPQFAKAIGPTNAKKIIRLST